MRINKIINNLYMLRILNICLLSSFVFVAMAQRHVVVVNLDTHLPIEKVSVKTNVSSSVLTDRNGMVSIPEKFDTISFRHLKYLPEKICYSEIADTMYLVKKDMMLPEVVVTGLNPDLKKAMKKNHESMMLSNNPNLLTFDFANILDRRARRDRKHYRKAKKILRDWDLAD